MYSHDNRVVITLDAGGTNFVFGAMQANQFIVEPITMPSHADNLDECLATMVDGFRQVIARLPEQPVAISFAFPGPADYPNGIIGGYLPNFPSFRDGVALGPFLEATFGIPVFINNDGDLFAYGEALGGALPEVNARLEALNSPKRYKNLLGYTFGTGFGIGIVVDNRLNRGDNSCVETFCLKHKKFPDVIVEEGVAVRAIRRVYGERSGNPDHGLEPKDICEIADGTRPGDQEAARQAFAEFGEVAGDVEVAGVAINLPADYYLDEEYIPEVDRRVLVYRKVAAADTLAAVDEAQRECEDRYGELPLAARNLFDRARLRIRAERLGLESIALSAGRLVYQGVDVPKAVAFDLRDRLGAVNFPKSRKLSVPYKAGAGSGPGVGRGLDANDPAGPVAAALKVLEQLAPSGDDD